MAAHLAIMPSLADRPAFEHLAKVGQDTLTWLDKMAPKSAADHVLKLGISPRTLGPGPLMHGIATGARTDKLGAGAQEPVLKLAFGAQKPAGLLSQVIGMRDDSSAKMADYETVIRPFGLDQALAWHQSKNVGQLAAALAGPSALEQQILGWRDRKLGPLGAFEAALARPSALGQMLGGRDSTIGKLGVALGRPNRLDDVFASINVPGLSDQLVGFKDVLLPSSFNTRPAPSMTRPVAAADIEPIVRAVDAAMPVTDGGQPRSKKEIARISALIALWLGAAGLSGLTVVDPWLTGLDGGISGILAVALAATSLLVTGNPDRR